MPLSITTVNLILNKISPILLADPTLLELDGPIGIVGDIHGQLEDLLRAFSVHGLPPNSKYLFMGDYVDRGSKSLEVICLLYALKIQYPKNVFLLRGNHETASQSESGGFMAECLVKANKQVWEKFCDTFNCLPLAAIVNHKYFCVHGGISPQLSCLSQIRAIKRPLQIPIRGLITDLTWSDPDPKVLSWGPNSRGETVTWGLLSAKKFLKANGLSMIVRGHQIAPNGYNFPFPEDESVVTVFSASKNSYLLSYKAAIMEIAEDNTHSFTELVGNVPRMPLVKSGTASQLPTPPPAQPNPLKSPPPTAPQSKGTTGSPLVKSGTAASLQPGSVPSRARAGSLRAPVPSPVASGQQQQQQQTPPGLPQRPRPDPIHTPPTGTAAPHGGVPTPPGRPRSTAVPAKAPPGRPPQSPTELRRSGSAATFASAQTPRQAATPKRVPAAQRKMPAPPTEEEGANRIPISRSTRSNSTPYIQRKA